MWKTVSLSDVCNVSIGKTPPRGDKLYWDEEKITNNVWLSIADLSSSNDKYISDSKEYLSNEGASLFKSVPKNTLIMSFKLSIGKLAFTKCELRTNEAIAALSILDESLLLKEFLYYYLSSLNWDVLAGHDQKVKGKTLNKKKLNALEITLPPLAEQKRIVAKLDTAFAEIDKAVSKTLKKIKINDDLFDSVLNKTFQNLTCEYKNLDNICKIVGGGTPSKQNKSFYGGTIPWATVRDLGYDNLNETEHKITDNAVSESSTNIIPSGNIVIATRVGLGKVCTLSQNTAINQDLKGIIPINNEKTDIGFLFFWFKSIRNMIINAGTGATVQGVRLDFIKSLKIPNLDLTLQKQIATKLSIISEKNKLLSSIYKEKINNLTKLKSNISKQEFEIGKSA